MSEPQSQTQNAEIADEIIRAVTEVKLKFIRNDFSIMRWVRGIASILELDVDKLVWEVAKLGDVCLVRKCPKQDEELMIEGLVERVTDILADAGAWDEYHAERAPSAYRYAAAVALWFDIMGTYVGGHIPVSHPLFSDAVAAAIARFLATHVARYIADALSSELKNAKRKYRPT